MKKAYLFQSHLKRCRFPLNVSAKKAYKPDEIFFFILRVDMSGVEETSIEVTLSFCTSPHELLMYSGSQLGTCVVADANPAANITWLRNNKPLVDGGDGM